MDDNEFWWRIQRRRKSIMHAAYQHIYAYIAYVDVVNSIRTFSSSLHIIFPCVFSSFFLFSHCLMRKAEWIWWLGKCRMKRRYCVQRQKNRRNINNNNIIWSLFDFYSAGFSTSTQFPMRTRLNDIHANRSEHIFDFIWMFHMMDV